MKLKIELELDTDRDSHEIEQLIELAEKIRDKAREANEEDE